MDSDTDSRNSFERWYGVKSRGRTLILSPEDVQITTATRLGPGSALRPGQRRHSHHHLRRSKSSLSYERRSNRELQTCVKRNSAKTRLSTPELLLLDSQHIRSDFVNDESAKSNVTTPTRPQSTKPDPFSSKSRSTIASIPSLSSPTPDLWKSQVSNRFSSFQTIRRSYHRFVSLQEQTPIYSYRAIDIGSPHRSLFFSQPNLNWALDEKMDRRHQILTANDSLPAYESKLEENLLELVREPAHQAPIAVTAELKTPSQLTSSSDSKSYGMIGSKQSKPMEQLSGLFQSQAREEASPDHSKQLEIVDENDNLIGYAKLIDRNKNRIVLKNVSNTGQTRSQVPAKLSESRTSAYEPYSSEDEVMNNIKRFYSREYELRNTNHLCNGDRIWDQIQKSRLDYEQDRKTGRDDRHNDRPESRLRSDSLKTGRSRNRWQSSHDLAKPKSYMHRDWNSMKDVANPFRDDYELTLARTRCGRCRHPVFFAENVDSMATAWHLDCLRCLVCQRSLARGKHSVIDGFPVCSFPCGIRFQDVPYRYYPGSNESRP